ISGAASEPSVSIYLAKRNSFTHLPHLPAKRDTLGHLPPSTWQTRLCPSIYLVKRDSIGPLPPSTWQTRLLHLPGFPMVSSLK
ncbi:hypothetical protein BC937DRAFT_95146, partial [Endogone sp. FLAS-F59071]